MGMNKKSIFLFCSSLSLFCFFFVYDIPASLNSRLATPTEMMLLYIAYSIPNIFLPSQYIKKKLLSIFVISGHIIFCIGMYLQMFKLMFIGRLIFGLGNDALTIFMNKKVCESFCG